MQFLAHIDPGNLHHAYFVQGDVAVQEALAAHLEGALKNLELRSDRFDIFGIDEARALIRAASFVSQGEQVFVYSVHGAITTEAQNALLKLFEEPPMHTYFFMCVANPSALLPTLRSRAVLIEGARAESTISGKEFLKVTPKERLALLAPLLKEKDVAALRALCTGVEEYLYVQLPSGKERDAVLGRVTRLTQALGEQGSSLKIVSEALAVVVPQLP